MAKLVNWRELERTLKEKGLLLFTATDIRRLFGVSRIAVTFLLHRYFKKGFIVRVKRGLYALPDTLPPEVFIANKMVEPSYVSLEFALSYHRVIPETVYELTSVTTKSTRHFTTLGKTYSYRNVQKEAFTGYNTEKQRGFSFRVADPEKALVDADYFRMRNGLEPIERFDKAKINSEKALRYAKLFGNARFIGIIESILQ